MRIYTKITWNMNTLKIVETEFYDGYSGPLSLLGGGPSAGEEAVAGQQNQLFNTMTQQAGQVFGASSNVFNQLMGTFSPLVAAGPGQYGFSEAQDQNLRSGVISNAGQAVKNATQVAAEGAAAAGGGNVMIPSGSQAALQSRINTAGAMNTAAGLNQVTEAGFQQGRQNWASAVQGELAAPGVFSPATAAGTAAGQIGSSAFSMQDKMQQERSQGGIMGALGGILGAAGTVLGGPAGGAIGSAIGKGIGGGGSNSGQGDASGAVFTGMAPGTNSQGFGPNGEDYSMGI